MRRIASVCLWTLAVSGCESTTGTEMEEQTVPAAVVQQLIEDIVVGHMGSASYATLFSERGTPTLAFGLQLPGVDHGSLGSGSSFPTAPTGVGDPFCIYSFNPPEDPFWEGKDSCTRLSKWSGTEYTIDVYFTVQPVQSPDEGHEFTYESEVPVGTFTFDPNPVITYDYDFSGATADRITASGEFALTFEDESALSVDLSHTAEFTGEYGDDGFSVGIELQLAANPLCETSLGVVLTDVDDEVTGEITCGTTLLATIGHGAEDFTFQWQ